MYQHFLDSLDDKYLEAYNEDSDETVAAHCMCTDEYFSLLDHAAVKADITGTDDPELANFVSCILHAFVARGLNNIAQDLLVMLTP